jgi:hypothetical protein
MSRFVQSLLLAWLVWVHASHGAADSGSPEAFAERWVVVVGNSENARRARLAAARRKVHVLPSDRFSGMSPGYYVLAEGPFDALKDAQRLVAELAHRGMPAYVKFTGAWRAKPPADPEDAGAPSPKKSDSDARPRALPGPKVLSEAQRDALERWRLVSQRTTAWNASYEILGVFESVSDPSNAILVHERVSVDGDCKDGYRELQLTSRSDQPVFSSARALGHRCCAFARCSDPGPGDLMLQLLQDPEDAGWAIDAKTGVAIDDPPHASRRVRPPDVEQLGSLLSFHPSSDSFECQGDFRDGVARCFKYSGGQGHDFVWVRRDERAVLDRIVTAYRK